MRVSFESDPTASFADITADADFGRLVALTGGTRTGRIVVGGIVRNYKSLDATAEIMTRAVRFFASAHPETPDDLKIVCEELPPLLLELYRRFGPERLRGALLECLVFECIRSRYEDSHHEENVFVCLDNGDPYRTPRSVDVAGWDGAMGECHDCKSRAKNFKLDLARSMEENLPAKQFRIALVSLDSAGPMARTLRDSGFVPGPQTTLVALEQLWDLAPLQPARAA